VSSGRHARKTSALAVGRIRTGVAGSAGQGGKAKERKKTEERTARRQGPPTPASVDRQEGTHCGHWPDEEARRREGIAESITSRGQNLRCGTGAGGCHPVPPELADHRPAGNGLAEEPIQRTRPPREGLPIAPRRALGGLRPGREPRWMAAEHDIGGADCEQPRTATGRTTVRGAVEKSWRALQDERTQAPLPDEGRGPWTRTDRGDWWRCGPPPAMMTSIASGTSTARGVALGGRPCPRAASRGHRRGCRAGPARCCCGSVRRVFVADEADLGGSDGVC